MNKKILIALGLVWSFSAFSQATNTPLTDSYQPPQTVINVTVQLLPGFHADSKNISYNNGGQFIARAKNYDPSNPNGEISAPPVAHTPSSGENYVYTRSYLAPVTTSNNYAPQVQSITYFDGLGRPKQNISIKSTPGGNDMVTPIIYDGFGRQKLDYLPVPTQGSSNGTIYSQSVSATPNIPVPFPVADAGNIYQGEAIYTEKIFENSPLDRVLGQVGPGSDWKTQNKSTAFEYETNIASEVLKFTTSTSWSSEATKSVLSLGVGNYHTAATLYKNKIKDEDDNVSYEFKNGQGQTLLVRKMLTATDPVDTYYVYNEYDQLAFVVSPKASDKIRIQPAAADLSETGEILKELSYQYRYDGRSRLVEKKLPGKGWEYMVYDKQDRLAMTQDAVIGANQQWLFTKYDQFGRVAYTGLFTSSKAYDSPGRLYEQKEVEKVVNNVSRTGDSSGFTAPGLIVYYDNDVLKNYPNAIDKLLSVNYYDTYPKDQPAAGTLDFTQAYITDNAQQSNISTKSLPVASYLNNIEMNSWTKTFSYYDDKGRAFASYSKNYLGGYTKTESVLDFTGTPQSTITRHKRKTADTEVKIAERFKYDYQNRLMEHYHQVNSKPEVLLTKNTYDELGRLFSKRVGDNLQEINYSYNVRGWMTGINDISSLGNDLFAYNIKYTAPNIPSHLTKPYLADQSLEVKKKYNGNISQIEWISVNPDLSVNPLKSYGYSYDSLNRLNAGLYYAFNSGQYTFTGANTEVPAYDVNGNITSLKRFSYDIGTAPSLIDDLAYVYTNTGNRVTSISDASQDGNGYEGGGNTIGYDANGNMITMPDKRINTISYNHLNLPNAFDIGSGKSKASISNTYRADGTKLKKIFTSMGPGLSNTWVTKVATTHYIDGFQYFDVPASLITGGLVEEENELGVAMEREAFQREEAVDLVGPPGGSTVENVILQFVPTAEGYYSFTENRYIYQYKDHLGNTRVSFARNSAGGIDVTDNNNYYPFGMNHLDNPGSYFGQSSYKNYKYNGKELQETGMYDYGARFYMPDIGRWGVHDPLSDATFQPYNYANNNPIFYNDPTGMVGEAFASTDVVRNKDGSYKVVGAYDDGDTNIYVVNNEKDKKRTGEVIGQTMTPVDFMSANNKDGSLYFDKNETGVTFNLNNLTVSGTAKDKKGRSAELEDLDAVGLLQWIKQYYMNTINGNMPGTPYGWLEVLRELSANGSILDVKVSMGLHPYTAIGNGKNSRGKPIITTLRAMGNIGFGANMLLSKPPIVGKNYWYGVIMNKAGQYNQSKNGGNGYNAHYPYFGEHSYSGSFIYFGYFRQFYKK